MLKMSVILSFLLLLSTTVQAASTSALKNIVDEFNYALTVEWDQQDKTFYQNEIQKFQESLSALEEQGLSQEEVMDFLQSEMKNEKLAKEIKQTMSLIEANKLDPQIAHERLIVNIKNTYQQGASWNGGVFWGVTIGGLVVLWVAVGIIIGYAVDQAHKNYDPNAPVTNSSSCNAYAVGNYCYQMRINNENANQWYYDMLNTKSPKPY